MTTSSPDSDSHTYISKEQEKWVLGATILASSMAFIDGSALGIALPAIQADFDVSGSTIFWVVNAYLLMLASLLLVGGALGDRYGRKKVFRMGILVFTGASMLAGLAPNASILIAGRALQGIGGALMVPGSLSIISVSFPTSTRGRAIGTWSMFSSLTTILGPAVGGFLAGAGLWRGIFFMNLPLAAASLYLLQRVPESRDDSAKPLDIPGALLVTIGLGGLTYGFIQAPQLGWTAPPILIGLMGGVVALLAFVWWENRTAAPMMPLELFKNRTFSGANLLTLFLYGALGVTLTFLPLLLVQVQHYKEWQVGLAMMPFAIILSLMSRWAGGLVDRIGSRLPLIIGPALVGVGFAALALPGLRDGAADYWTTYFPAIVIIAVGMGITVAPLTTTVMNAAPPDATGAASGINNAVSRIGQVLALAILGSVALIVFRSAFLDRIEKLEFLSVEERAGLEAEADKLAEAAPPETLDEEEAAVVLDRVQWSFLQTFRLIAVIGAALAWISAGAAAVLIQGKRQNT